MTKEEATFLIICLINFLAALCFLVMGLFRARLKMRQETGDTDSFYDGRGTFVICFFVMLLCPVIGPCFFLMGHLTYRIFFHQEVDLTDVIFRKERSRQFVRDDEEKEHNMASIEETLLLADRQNERSLILSVIQRDLNTSLSSLVMALNSEDSETSHYAASALQDFFSDFRILIRKLSNEMEAEGEDETKCEELIIDYMGKVLKQNVFTGTEQKRHVKTLDDAGERLFRKRSGKFTTERYENIILCLLKQNEFERSAVWCGRLTECFPDELCAYKCRLRLYYAMGNSDAFFELLKELKHCSIMYDKETIEIIRMFE